MGLILDLRNSTAHSAMFKYAGPEEYQVNRGSYLAYHRVLTLVDDLIADGEAAKSQLEEAGDE